MWVGVDGSNRGLYLSLAEEPPYLDKEYFDEPSQLDPYGETPRRSVDRAGRRGARGSIAGPTRLPRMADHVQVSTAAPTREVAIQLLNSAVKARLAAGGQVLGPAVTAFWHLGELGNGEEWVVVLKTTSKRYPDLEAHLIEAHPWDSPEVSFTPLGGSAAYLRWLERATS